MKQDVKLKGPYFSQTLAPFEGLKNPPDTPVTVASGSQGADKCKWFLMELVLA